MEAPDVCAGTEIPPPSPMALSSSERKTGQPAQQETLPDKDAAQKVVTLQKELEAHKTH